MENDLDEGGSAEPLPLPFRIIETLFGSILALLFITLICTVGANVAGRFLFNYSWPGPTSCHASSSSG